MKALYAHCGITKQAHYQQLSRAVSWQQKEAVMVGLMLQIREIHPGMGLRTMYEIYAPEGIGRDAFISIGLHYGFRVKAFGNETRTTFSSPYARYPNLLSDRIIQGVNQVWTSDLTYFRLGNRFAYIVFIMDVYSRLIVGYWVAEHMRAENNLQALQRAFRKRGTRQFAHQLIHHRPATRSDRGGQYISELYTQALAKAQVRISMCQLVYENAHVERVNGTIKNQYLAHWNITSFAQLQKRLKQAVEAYNESKPHTALGKKSPQAFERYVSQLPRKERPRMRIWTENSAQITDPNQCIIPF
ncbi:MAG: DDE-type integrase/transposase/recombinase [Bacteroidota bacterium]